MELTEKISVMVNVQSPCVKRYFVIPLFFYGSRLDADHYKRFMSVKTRTRKGESAAGSVSKRIL